MNLAQLEYLRELYNYGSFSDAANKLGITQPALSLQIQKLEEELDYHLIDRSKRPFQFTNEGIMFYEKTVDILQQVEQLKQISVEIGEEIKGNLKIGIIPTVAPYLVPLFIQQLKKQFPGLILEVSEIKTGKIVSEIKMGNIDCGIVSTPISFANLNFIPLFYERFFAYVSVKNELISNEKIEISKIEESEVWYLNEGNCFQNQVNSVCQIQQNSENKKNLDYNTDSIESLRRIVENENGLTFIPELATINIPVEQEELIKEFNGDPPVREISIVTAKKYAKVRQVKALKQVIQQSIPKRMIEKPKSWIVDTRI